MLHVLHLTYPIVAATVVLVAAPGSMSLDLSGPNFEVSPVPSSVPGSYLLQSLILK
jgi:hypothetical protein